MTSPARRWRGGSRPRAWGTLSTGPAGLHCGRVVVHGSSTGRDWSFGVALREHEKLWGVGQLRPWQVPVPFLQKVPLNSRQMGLGEPDRIGECDEVHAFGVPGHHGVGQ